MGFPTSTIGENLLSRCSANNSPTLASHREKFVIEKMGKSRKTSKQSQTKKWNPETAVYADLRSPEWVTMDCLPKGFWEDSINWRRYFDWLAIKLGIERPEDWYQVSRKDIVERRGEYLLRHFNSHVEILQILYPKFDFKPWLFPVTPIQFWNDPKNVKRYLRWFEKQVGIKRYSDWYKISYQDFVDHHGVGLVEQYNGSVFRMLTSVFPEKNWKPWLHHQTPHECWHKKANRIEYLKWLGKKLGFKKREDWYQATDKLVRDNCGASLITKYHLIDLLRELYPDFSWHPWKFDRVRHGYWEKKEHRIEYLKWLGNELGFRNPQDWYALKGGDFTLNFGVHLYNHYYQDLSEPVKELYPDRQWQIWNFHAISPGFWDDQKSCRKYIRWLTSELGYPNMSQWHLITHQEIVEVDAGTGFLAKFKTFCKALQFAYPKRNWLPWTFVNTQPKFWKDIKNRRSYYRWLGKKLKFRKREDWMQLDSETLRTHGGIKLVRNFQLQQVIQEAMETAS